KLSGVITSDLTMKGKYSSVNKGNYDQFAASGNLNVADLNYAAKDLKKPVNIKTVSMTFNPRNISLNSFVMKEGNTDLTTSSSLENFIAYVLKNETIKGKLEL